jgi:hypothetical protein
VSGHEIGLWVITGLSLAAGTTLVATRRAARGRLTEGGELLGYAAGFVLAAWAVIGWAWWLTAVVLL